MSRRRSQEQCPYLRFTASDAGFQQAVDDLSERAAAQVEAGAFGDTVWHSATLPVVGFRLAPPFSIGSLLQQLGSQTRIVGWRRLGGDALIEFTEEEPPDGNAGNAGVAPKAMVHIHIAIPAPCHGHFSSLVATMAVEITAAICTFALGRGVELPPSVFPSETEQVPGLMARRTDQNVPGLARKHVSLDILGSIVAPGGMEHFSRMRAAFLTFDAAVQQQRDAIACILYVVVAEAISTPDVKWHGARLTKRFIEFFTELMPASLDEIVAHANFEDVFGIPRGTRSSSALRRDLLSTIYDFRSGHLHAGLKPAYQGMLPHLDAWDGVRRALFADFAESAILSYLSSPRSSLIGHPGFVKQPCDEDA